MSVSYTKNEMIAEMSGKLGLTGEQMRSALDEFLACLSRAFERNEKVAFRDFGVFEVRLRKAKLGRNPRRPTETYRVPPKRIVRFRAGRELDNLLNSGTT